MRKPTPVQNNRLSNAIDVASIERTTTNNGRRTRQTCGFFVSQIPFKGLLRPENVEFAIRLISRNKPSNRTNKASRLFAVVETVSHLSAIFPFHSLTKQTTMLYKFLCLDREATTFHTQILTVQADNENEAHWQLSARWQWLMTVAKNLPNRTACKQATEVSYA